MLFRVACGLAIGGWLTLGRGWGEEVTIHPVADTCLFEWTADYNFGAQEDLPAGGLGGAAGSLRLARSLFKFDVAAAIPAGATITAAEMTLHVTMAPESGARSSEFALHRVLVDWGEGDKEGERPGGALASAGEATWNSRLHLDEGWSSPGGQFGIDFATEQSASKDNVDAVGGYVFVFDEGGVADVQSMVEVPGQNFGWMLYSLGEGMRLTARRWSARESAGPKPELKIAWTLPLLAPEITSVELNEAGDGILVRVDGLAGLRYESEISSDLVGWDPGEVQTPATDGELIFALPVGARGFFRVTANRQP